MNYINRKGKLSLQISVFSNIECLLEYTKQNIVDILLMGEDGILELGNLKDVAEDIYILTERQCVQENYGYPTIYKFQSADQIIMKILELYMADKDGKNELINSTYKDKTIIGVFSPKGGSKKTSLSLALSNYFGTSQKTLYVNFELFCELSFLCTGEKSGFSELLYYIKQKKSNLSIKLNSVVCNYNKFDFIPAANHYLDLLEMNEDDINFFIQCLRNYSDYEVIIFDIGFFDKSILELLNCCDKIYVPVSNDWMSTDKKEAFYKQLNEVKEEDILKKLEEIDLPGDETIFTEMSIDSNYFSEGTLYNYVTNLFNMEV